MQYAAIFLLITCLQVSAIGTAQTISLSEKNASLETVLEKVRKQSNCAFFYKDQLLQRGKSVSLSVKDAQLKQVLDLIFANQPLSYEIVSDQFVVIKEKGEYTAPLPPADTTVRGVISDEKGDAVEGVTILEKGTNNVTSTDNKGNFTIKVKSRDAHLLASHISYDEKEITIAGRTSLAVTMTARVKVMEEQPIVIGYQTVRKKDLTGAVSTVTSAQLKDLPVNSAAQAITGQLAGVRVATSEGGPGAPVKITVRGGGSITQDNSPLYVIDGIQVEDGINSISPQDIESINVLKDASATAIYGARGANGVVLITTKGGKLSKTTVTYNGFVGINKLANKLRVMNPGEFINYQYERTKGGITDSLQFVNIYGKTFDTLAVYASKPFVDWQDEMFGRDALTQTHNISISGGTQTTTFLVSLTKNKEQSVMNRSDFDRNLINLRLDHKVSNKFKVGVNLRFNNQTINGGGTSASGASINSKLRHTVKYRPFLMNTTSPEEFDQAYFDQTSTSGMYLINPIQLNEAEYRNRVSYNTNLNGYGEYSFTPYLSFRATAGVDRYSEKYSTFDDYLTWTAIENSSGLPMVSVSNSNRTSINISNVLTFNNSLLKSDFHSKHRIQALIGQEIYKYTSDAVNDRLRYFPKGIVAEKALAQLSLGTSFPLYPNALATESHISSFFSRINYAFRNKYIATFTIRADGSSKFAPGNQWGYFPSGALAWRISEEGFFKKTSVVNDLKLRLTYGQSGNNRIGDFLFTSLYASNSAPYGLNDVMTAGYSITALANPNIKWETTISRNLGLDIALLNSRLQFTADFYINDTRDLLINVPIATNSGYSSQIQNIGSTRNKGMEFQINSSLINSKDFRWNANFNIAFNRNKIKSLANGMNSYFANSGWGVSGQLPDFIVKVGEPVGAMYGYVSDGYYTLSDFDYNAATKIYTLKKGVANNTGVVGPPQPGSLKLKDLSGDGFVDADNDRTILGDAQPAFFGGFNNQFSYKNFDLSVFVNFTVGNKIFNGDKIEFSNAFNGNTNLLAIMNNRWKTIDEDGNVVQRMVAGPNGSLVPSGEAPEVLAALNKNANIWQPVRGSSASFLMHSWAVEDGSFLRLNNITFGYSLPKSLLNKLKSGGIRLYCTLNNIAVLTGYSGFDPEVSTKTAVPVTPGVDASPYPRSRSYIIGINAKF